MFLTATMAFALAVQSQLPGPPKQTPPTDAADTAAPPAPLVNPAPSAPILKETAPPPAPQRAPSGSQTITTHLIPVTTTTVVGAPQSSTTTQAAPALPAVAAPPAAAASTIAVPVHQPTIVGRGLGRLGQRMAQLGQPWYRVPAVQQQVVLTTTPVQQVVYQPVQASPPAPVVAPVMATPQSTVAAPRKCFLLRR